LLDLAVAHDAGKIGRLADDGHAADGAALKVRIVVARRGR
jgi:hypothetical protein